MSDNPPVLSPLVRSVSELTGRWWVAHTRARAEKAFAWDLLRRGTGYVLPMIERVRVSGGRKRRTMMPLFPSYVFVCGTQEDRHAAMATNRVCRTIEVADQAALVAELSAVRLALTGKASLDPYPFAAEGARCRVRAGAFQGLEGIVINRGKLPRLVLEISLLGRGVAMEIEADLLEAIG